MTPPAPPLESQEALDLIPLITSKLLHRDSSSSARVPVGSQPRTLVHLTYPYGYLSSPLHRATGSGYIGRSSSCLARPCDDKKGPPVAHRRLTQLSQAHVPFTSLLSVSPIRKSRASGPSFEISSFFLSPPQVLVSSSPKRLSRSDRVSHHSAPSPFRISPPRRDPKNAPFHNKVAPGAPTVTVLQLSRLPLSSH